MRNTPFSEDLIPMVMERFPWKNSTTLSLLLETLYLEFMLLAKGKIKNFTFFEKLALLYFKSLGFCGMVGMEATR